MASQTHVGGRAKETQQARLANEVQEASEAHTISDSNAQQVREVRELPVEGLQLKLAGGGSDVVSQELLLQRFQGFEGCTFPRFWNSAVGDCIVRVTQISQ